VWHIGTWAVPQGAPRYGVFGGVSPIKLDAHFFALNTKLGLLQFKKPGPFTLTYKTTTIVSEVMKVTFSPPPSFMAFGLLQMAERREKLQVRI
jgi:hypothetical protein